jgi:hypothetical protein
MYSASTRRSTAPRHFSKYQLRRVAARFLLAWRRAGQRPVLSTVVILLGSICSILLITALAGVQEPEVHDELAQLVQADIFAHGRLAESPHPFWRHFETVHVLSQPRYQSKYPPAPALFMAAGERLTGLPIVGVWLSVAFMIVSMAYAMYALLPARWALIGTSLVAVRFGIIGDWPHSYWGGAVAALAGGLVLGASARLWYAARVRDGILLGTGLVLLALTRPYEGFAYSLPAIAALAWRACHRSSARAALWRRAVPAIAMVGAAGLGWLCYYNWRVTGSPLTLPYVAYERAYSAAPLFVWQQPRGAPPLLTNRDMIRFEHEYAMQEALRAQRRWPVAQLQGVGVAVWDYLKPAMPLAFIGLLFARRSVRAKGAFAAAPLVTILSAMTLSCWTAPRYLAPATASIFAVATIGLSGLCRARIGRFRGSILAAGAVLLLVAAVPLVAMHYITDLRTSTEPWAQKRAIRERLAEMPGDDLVFVRYAATHNPVIEWVYNGADIDHQPIVWARETDAASNEALREYFRDRQAWIVLADEQPPRLLKWTGQSGEHVEFTVTRELLRR